MTGDKKQIPAPPSVTAVVISSGRFEATIRTDTGILMERIGDRGGRYKMFDLTGAEAAQVIDLIRAGRSTLQNLAADSA